MTRGGVLPNRKVIPWRRSKKGFTLIELLAVIVVLAIILLIATPMILNVINNARKGAFASSKKNIERAAELYYASNSSKVKFENEVSYVEIGTLIEEGYLKEGVVNALTKSKLETNTKVLIYKSGRNIEFSLQMYDEVFLNWYKEEMVKAAKKLKKEPIEDSIEVSLEELMNEKSVSELRLPLDLENRCVGYVEVTKENNKNEYQAYVDCLTESTSFASHYVSYGGKYLDEFLDVKETSDGGFIAVGRSNSEVITKYGTGNNGKYDAIIVKFNSKGEVEWSRNFGGSNDDIFNAVIEGPSGYVAVGHTSSDDGDINDYKGGLNDALIVAYDFKGNLVYKRSYGSSDAAGGSDSFKSLILDNNSYVIVGTMAGYGDDGDLEDENLVRANEGIILKLDLEFNQIWRKFFLGYNGEIFNKVIKTNNNSYIIVGVSNSNDYDMAGIGYETSFPQNEAIILEYSSINGELTNKKSFKGSRNEYFYGVVELVDGYIVVGSSLSNDYDVENLSKADNGYFDAVIVKYDKDLNVVWKKSFGGSNDDAFYGIEKLTETEVVVVGYSKSNDMDMEGISKSNEGYSNAVIVKYNADNGNIIDKKVFGGSNSENFSSIIKTKNNELIISGSSYSMNQDLKRFNKGHQDAIVVKYNSNLNLKKDLEEQVILIDKIKKINSNYGIDMSLKYDKIYTTNDPEKDLKGWCSSYEPYLTENTSNYYFGSCLKPYNDDDRKLLVEKEVSGGLKMYKGEYNYNITLFPDNEYNWHQIRAYSAASSGNIEHSNLKLKFNDGYIGYITDAINKGYIEPLVVVNTEVYAARSSALLPSVINIINENGKTGVGSYPTMYINIKPKKSKLIGIVMTSNRNSGLEDGLSIFELRNFDMSITPTN